MRFPLSSYEGIKPASPPSQALLSSLRLEPRDKNLACHCFSGCLDSDYVSGPILLPEKLENWFEDGRMVVWGNSLPSFDSQLKTTKNQKNISKDFNDTEQLPDINLTTAK